jgi:hypothetical protein
MVFIRLFRSGRQSWASHFLLISLQVTGLLEHLEACRKELKPFLANLGTRMRAVFLIFL